MQDVICHAAYDRPFKKQRPESLKQTLATCGVCSLGAIAYVGFCLFAYLMIHHHLGLL